MNPLPFRGAALVAVVLSLFAAPVPALAASADAPNVTLNVKSDAEALAQGYAAAFEALPNAPVFITYERSDKGFVTLAGIRSVRAAGGVLIIRTDRGPTFAVPARSIVIMTDERPGSP